MGVPTIAMKEFWKLKAMQCFPVIYLIRSPGFFSLFLPSWDLPFAESCVLPSPLQILDDTETENGQTRQSQNSDTIDHERHQTVGQRPSLWKVQSRSQALVEPNTTMERPAHLRFGKYRTGRGSKGQSSKLAPNCHQSNTSRPIKHPIQSDIILYDMAVETSVKYNVSAKYNVTYIDICLSCCCCCCCC